MVTFIGESLSAWRTGQAAAMRIATVFPKAGVIVTVPGIHATQREAYLERLRQERKAAACTPLTDAQEQAILEDAVDLIIEGETVLIRPDPDRMDLAFQADGLLQEVVSKRQIRFLFVSDQRVRDAISMRGEAWRINPLPRSTDAIKQMIAGACISVGGQAIYYYNALTGSRILTCDEFSALGQMDDATLRQHLVEISELSAKRNEHGWPELELFMADERLLPEALVDTAWRDLPAPVLRARFAELVQRFHAAVAPEFQQDDPEDGAWRNRMYAALVGHRDDELSESDLLGLSAEFFMQIEWLPGARVEGGELTFDSVSDEVLAGDARDMIVHGLICNLVQEYSDLDFINIGRVITSLSRRTTAAGRREVYVAHLRERGAAHDTLQIIRMQKWGVREHLDEGKSLLQAMIESEEYTDYIVDRRLGCKQLGMNVPISVLVRKVRERYDGRQKALAGTVIWSPYFERNYVAGIASDKIPTTKLRQPQYARALAGLLGRAAAPNIIVGRCDADGRVIFDDGDEVVLENGGAIPVSIIVADHTGTFGAYRNDLLAAAEAYAVPVNRRAAVVPDPAAFAEAYLEGLRTRFREIQHEYHTRQRAFDALFKHQRCDPAGNFAFRWKLVLMRLGQANPDVLVDAVRAHIKLKP